MTQLDFINQKLHQKNKAKAYINNADGAMVEYYRVFAKQIKPLANSVTSFLLSIRRSEKW